MTFHRRERARASALLRRSGRMADATESEPEPGADALGARAGLGFFWTGGSAAAAVYEFDTYGQARSAGDHLVETSEGPRQIDTSVNGTLLLVASADADDEDGQELVDDLLAAFAGRE